MTLGELIKKYRADNDISMDVFAKNSGLSKAYISMLENNKNPKTGKPIIPSIPTYQKAAEGMHISIVDLFSVLAPVPFETADNENEQITSAMPLSDTDLVMVEAFHELNEVRQKQFTAFMNYLLSEQRLEKNTKTTTA